MHKYFWPLFLAPIILLVGVGAQAADRPSLAGVWEGSYGEYAIEFKLNDDLTFLGSSGSVFFTGRYQADFSKTPHLMDIIVDLGEEAETWLTIFRFVDENRIEVEEPDRKRPKDFTTAPVTFVRKTTPAQVKQKPRPNREFDARPMKRP